MKMLEEQRLKEEKYNRVMHKNLKREAYLVQMQSQMLRCVEQLNIKMCLDTTQVSQHAKPGLP